MPELGKTFAKLSQPQYFPLHTDDLDILEIFVMYKMYNKTLDNKSLDDARKVLVFEKGFNAEQLPPTSELLSNSMCCKLCFNLGMFGATHSLQCKTYLIHAISAGKK